MATKFMSLDDEKREVKETVFTYCLVNGLDSNMAMNLPSDFKNVLHIGNDKGYGDVFKCWDDNVDNFTLYVGTKGNENYEK